MDALLCCSYLPPLCFWAAAYHADNVWIESCCHYTKQSYRNRTVIASANGPLFLSIPVEKGDGDKILTRSIGISSHSDWKKNHWHAISSAYCSSPFFEYYEQDLNPFYRIEFEFLFEWNQALVELVKKWLDIDITFLYTSDYLQTPPLETLDLRSVIHPKKTIDWDLLPFRSVPYWQVFQQKFGFLQEMSILDLIFNMGPEAVLVLDQMKK